MLAVPAAFVQSAWEMGHDLLGRAIANGIGTLRRQRHLEVSAGLSLGCLTVLINQCPSELSRGITMPVLPPSAMPAAG